MADNSPSPTVEQFKAHQIHTSVTQWTGRLPRERPENLKELPEEVRDSYVRLRWVIRELKSRLDNIHPLLSQKKFLDGLVGQFSALESAWQQFRSAPKSQWQQLNNRTDALIDHVRNLPPIRGMEASIERLEEFASDMNSAISEAREKVESLQGTADSTQAKHQEAQAKLQALESEIQAQKARLDSMLTQHNEVFTKAEQERSSQFSKNAQEISAGFSDEQSQRKEKFDKLLAEFDAAKEETIEKHQSALSTVEAEGKSQSAAMLKSLQEQLTKAEELVGILVKTSMSGTYQIIATRELWNAWIMRIVAIVSFITVGVLALWAISSLTVGPNGFDWGTPLFRLSFGLLFLIPGFYSARESTRHWDQEKHNRRIAMELTVFDAFIKPLEEAKRQEIVERKADEYFGKKSPHDEGEDSSSLKDLHFTGNQLAMIAKEIVKILKAK